MSSKLAGLNQGFPLSPLKWRPMVPREITHLGRKPKQRLDVRKTVACTQADNSQVTTLFMHASHNSRCSGGPPRELKFRKTIRFSSRGGPPHFGNDWRRTTQRSGEQKRTLSQPPPPPSSCSPSISLPRPPHTHHPAQSLAASPLATAPPIRQKAHREHRRKCGGRTRQPRGPLTRCLGEMPTAFACRRRAMSRFHKN
jgi:hypothetical protein